MNNWIWALAFTVLGSAPEHGSIEKFKTKQECEIALIALKEDYKQKKKEVVATCFLKLK